MDENRYRPEALATLYDLEPDLREVIVEGRVDSYFYQWFLDCAGLDNQVQVFAVKDRVLIEDSTVIEHGHFTGARGCVVTVAEIVNNVAPSQKTAVFIADADYGPIGEDPYPDFSNLLYTDYGSLEVYAFNARTMEKILRVILRVPRSISTEKIMSGIIEALKGVFIARLAVRSAPGGASLIKKYADCCTMSDGALKLDYESLLKRSFSSVEKVDREGWDDSRLKKNYLDLIGREVSDVRVMMSGHDLSSLLIRYLKIAAPQVFKEDRKGFENSDTMERSLVGALEHSDVSYEPLFVELLSRFS
ncbi:hypothetical protein [Streptomyces canus]|uniref:hypothetical protein n=1 Tax=Streptomyces canus TaxID=58343 RepID=UPI0030E4B1B3